jgi:hypothetical protein
LNLVLAVILDTNEVGKDKSLHDHVRLAVKIDWSNTHRNIFRRGNELVHNITQMLKDSWNFLQERYKEKPPSSTLGFLVVRRVMIALRECSRNAKFNKLSAAKFTDLPFARLPDKEISHGQETQDSSP